MEFERFNKDEDVRLDKDFRNSSIVTVVIQTPDLNVYNCSG